MSEEILDMNQCRRETLAKSDGCVIERCGCGAIHFTIGAMTLRLARADFDAIHATMSDALRSAARRPSSSHGGRLGDYLDG